MKNNKAPKPITAYMSWNYNNPWTGTTRRTRRDCVKAVRENLINQDDFKKCFTIRKVKITA